MKTQSIKLAYLLSIGSITEVQKDDPELSLEPEFLTSEYTIYKWSAKDDREDLDFLTYVQAVKSIKYFITNAYEALS